MNITEFSAKYDAAFRKVFGNDEIFCIAEFDLSSGDEYIEGIAAVTEKAVAFFENGTPVSIFPIESIETAICRQLRGCGILEFKISGTYTYAARFSMIHAEEFSALAETVNDVKAGLNPEKISVNEDIFCPECGKPYIKDTHVCRYCMKKSSVLKRIWNLSKSCRPLYLILMLLFWGGSIATVVSPMVTKFIVNDVLIKKGLSFKALVLPVVLLFALGIMNMIVSVFRTVISSKASNLLVRDLRNEIYEKLQNLPLGYVEKKKTGDLIQRINNDTQRIQSFIQDIAIMAINEICLFIAIAIVTFSINYKMALLIFVPIPVAGYMIYMIRTNIRKRYRKQWQKMDKLTSRLNDVLNGIKVVKVFGREKDEIERFAETSKTVRDMTCENEKYVYTIFPIIKFIMGFGSYLVLLYGGSCVFGGKLTLGELVQFSSYGGYLYSKLEWFGMLPNHISMAVTSAQRIFDVLDETYQKPEYCDKKAEKIDGEFDFKDLSFGYKSYEKVLHNINEHIKKGEMIGLVGHSGAGKSTLINLVMQLYNPTRGEILLDGEKLEKYNPEEYKKVIGVVLQESYLFSGSIIDNIRYAVPQASLEQCIDAAIKANAHDFIMQLPDGYDTYVGEKGYKLSGGERQRIAIARAILSEPQILILDEATASVDTETEAKIQESLAKIIKGRTVFAIAHRLSTLKQADRLFVLENGAVAETGTHEELVKKDGIYAKLLREQLQMTATSVTIDNIHECEENKKENIQNLNNEENDDDKN